jgi:CheY-like chemotaxis protein
VVELGKQKRVLIVDDDRLITDTLVRIFSQEGYESKGVYSAERALLVMEHWLPALVIINVLLPAMNGIDLAILIRHPVRAGSIRSCPPGAHDQLRALPRRELRVKECVRPPCCLDLVFFCEFVRRVGSR